MKGPYKKSIQLRCIVCGSADDFEYNEDKSYVKCKKCNKEYLGGYNELVEYNQEYIQDELDDLKQEVKNDVERDIQDIFKKAFKGSKNIKFK